MSNISVVIPTYNYGHYIEKTIHSVLNQTMLPGEIIIIDDGSTDNTEEIISKNFLNNENNRIKYIKKTNGGAASARNLGIKKAKGEFILMLDADDQLEPCSIEVFTEKLKQSPWADMVVGGSLSVKASGKKKHRPAPLLKKTRVENFKAFLNKKLSVSHGKFIVRRSRLNRIKYPEHLRSNEDISVIAQLLATCSTVRVDATIVNYFHHNDSLRYHDSYIEKAGLSVVDAVFNTSILPRECLTLRSRFYVHRCLSIFRRLYRAGQYKKAEKYFRLAAGQPFTVLFKWKYVLKYLRMKLKTGF